MPRSRLLVLGLFCATQSSACFDETIDPLTGGGGTATTVGVGGTPGDGGTIGGCRGEVEIVCNDLDDDCDPATSDTPDADMDGWNICFDCDDTNADLHPQAVDTCADDIDQDCDGEDPSCPDCGNDVVDPGEACDDGNRASDDGCNATCSAVEVCGDGIAQLALDEECDPPQDGACPGACSSSCLCQNPTGPWRFTEVSAQAGLLAMHMWDPTNENLHGFQLMDTSGGIATNDVDGDGWFDVFVVGCALGQTALYINRGNGTFTEATAAWGIAKAQGCDAGPVFADFDGDGADDLFVGAVNGAEPRLWLKRGDTFVDGTAAAGFGDIPGHVFGGALADIDQDGDLDLALARWSTPMAQCEHLFENDGGVFTPITIQAGLGELSPMTYTPNFLDLDEDGVIDLLWSADFHHSRYYLGDGGGRFTDMTSPVIDDENGMGAAIGDYDGDGDLDWFVTSIWDPDGIPKEGWGISGNRLYRNIGGGLVEDATDEAGLRQGYWGWGACFADFDNDGDLDLFHTNGFSFSTATEFQHDPSRLFISNGDGTFTERSFELGIEDRGQGRGVVCFDYDRDGDVDILVQQNRGPMRLYQNNGARGGHWLDVALVAPAPNAAAIGSRVEVTAAGVTRIGVVRAGSNYASQDPTTLRFGLGPSDTIESIVVKRPGGGVTTFGPFAADQRVQLVVP